MSYLTVIPLADAKTYLGIDGTDRDTEITRMINAACRYVEDHSNHIFVSRDKNYYYINSCVRVFDFPITAITFPDPNTTTKDTFENYAIYDDSNAENDYITLTVGYADPADIPPALVEAAYMVLEHMFNQKETGNSAIPMAARMLIRSNARHVI